MPESAKAVQAVECLADIRERGGTSSGIVVFDSEQRGTTAAHAARITSALILHPVVKRSCAHVYIMAADS